MSRERNAVAGLLLCICSGLALSGCEEISLKDEDPANVAEPENPPPQQSPEQSIVNTANAGALAAGTRSALDTIQGTASVMNVADVLTVACVTGVATPTGNAFADLMLAVGETFGVDFDNCTTADGLILDGSVSYTATAISGVFLDLFNDWSATFSVTFVGFTATQSGQTESLDDTYMLVFGYEAMTQQFTVSLDGETVVFQGGAVIFDALAYEEQNGDYQLSFAATLSMGQLTGDLALSTPQPLAGPIASAPESGEVLMTAGDGSALTMTFTGGGAVTIAIDEDGDGLPDCSQDLTIDTLNQFDEAACG